MIVGDIPNWSHCQSCQHGFFGQRAKKWFCEYPLEVERKCKSWNVDKIWYKHRWKKLDEDFAPEFIEEEEMKL